MRSSWEKGNGLLWSSTALPLRAISILQAGMNQEIIPIFLHILRGMHKGEPGRSVNGQCPDMWLWPVAQLVNMKPRLMAIKITPRAPKQRACGHNGRQNGTSWAFQLKLFLRIVHQKLHPNSETPYLPIWMLCFLYFLQTSHFLQLLLEICSQPSIPSGPSILCLLPLSSPFLDDLYIFHSLLLFSCIYLFLR